jgi:hypothetical protein
VSKAQDGGEGEREGCWGKGTNFGKRMLAGGSDEGGLAGVEAGELFLGRGGRLRRRRSGRRLCDLKRRSSLWKKGKDGREFR